MSTFHTLLTQGPRITPAFDGATPHHRDAVTVGIDERSGAFDLHVSSSVLRQSLRPDITEGAFDDATFEVATALSCADLRKIRDRINEVLSYFDEEAARPGDV